MSDAALGSSGYDRSPHDFYPTPAWVTETLCDTYRLRGVVWEPAAGRGDMANTLRDKGYQVVATDAFMGDVRHDFLSDPPLVGWYSIVTNPPYREIDRFIERGLELLRGLQVMAILARADFDSAARRRHFWQPPFACKIVLTKRPVWIEGPQKASPRFNYAWYVWDGARRDRGGGSEPVIRWAP